MTRTRAVEWMFRNRKTGEITVAQPPNEPLLVFLVAAGLRWAFDPSGTVRAALTVAATAALVLWALDEVIRGVNPWRRLLGAVVLAAQVVFALA